MAEKQVTIDGEVYSLEPPFMVIATQNPRGYHGTFPLPESQLDRFMMKISVSYPDPETEREILYQQTSQMPLQELEKVLTREEVIQLQHQLKSIHVDPSLADYLLEIVGKSRDDHRVELGCSPRGSISLFQAARGWALLQGRDVVLPDDIQQVAPMAFGTDWFCAAARPTAIRWRTIWCRIGSSRARFRFKFFGNPESDSTP